MFNPFLFAFVTNLFGSKMKGELSGGGIAKILIGLLIAAVFIAALLPGVITSINGTNTTGWTASQIALFGVVGIVIVAAVVYAIVKKSGLA